MFKKCLGTGQQVFKSMTNHEEGKVTEDFCCNTKKRLNLIVLLKIFFGGGGGVVFFLNKMM